MKGVILAGGEGTRLRKFSNGRNKHTVEVGGQPMITYPLRTLGALGCEGVVIVTSPTGLGDIREIVGDGNQFDMDVAYVIQEQPLGTANALQKAEGHIDDVFPLICGDVFIDPTPQPTTTQRPTLFWNEFELGNRHTVYIPSTAEVPAELIEKPTDEYLRERKAGKKAVVFYLYDQEVFNVIPGVGKSARGELELEDLHRHYLDKLGEEIMQQHTGFFGDMGTPDGLARVEDYIYKKTTAEF